MAKYSKPRAGSKGFSPRKRAKKETPTVSTFPKSDDVKLLGFAAYKVGMTHVVLKELDKNSPSSGMDVMTPVTILETPAMVVYGIRAYVDSYRGEQVLTDIFAEKFDKFLARKITIPKNPQTKENTKKIEENLDTIIRFSLLLHTQPSKTGSGKKTPDVLELAVGGDVKAQWEYCKSMLGKEIKASDVFSESDILDVLAVTTGKGTQGPVKRWGIKIQKRKHGRSGHARHVGSVGGWKPANRQWFVPQAGQTGYYNRTEYNKAIIKMGDNPDDVNTSSGFIKYGLVKGDYMLLKGSIPGPSKRLIALRSAIRSLTKEHKFTVEYISTSSNQGA
jgi:large subunit ribosomal protein L3